MQRKKRMAGAIAGIGFCILLGSGIALWEHFQGDEKEQQKKTPVSDEVAEIENLNARDHVLDLNHLFEEEDVTWKEKRALKKDAQKQAEMSDGKKKSADKKKDTKKDTEKETEGKLEVPQKPNEEPQQPQEPNGEPEVPQQPQDQMRNRKRHRSRRDQMRNRKCHSSRRDQMRNRKRHNSHRSRKCRRNRHCRK